MDYLQIQKGWYELGLQSAQSGDYAAAIDAFYKAGDIAIDELRNLDSFPELVRNRLKSKSVKDLDNTIDDLFKRENAVRDDGCDKKTLDAIHGLIAIVNEMLDKRCGMKGVAG